MMKKIMISTVLVLFALVITFLSGGQVCADEPDLERGAGSCTVKKGAYRSEPVTPQVFDGDLRDLPKAQPWKPGEPVTEIPRRVYPRERRESDEATPQVFDGDLRDLPKAEVWKPGDPTIEIPRRLYPCPKCGPKSSDDVTEGGEPWIDPLLHLQENVPAGVPFRGVSAPDLNFEGQDFSGVFPPDTVGEVGRNYYIQLVNHSSGTVANVYDKATGALIVGPVVLDSLWTAVGPCASGYGDPIPLYDPLADRWLVSEFASSGNHLCVYISQTSDPIAGGWFLYDFNVPFFPDYPKYAVWPDAYYVSTNEPSPAVYALDRAKMLNGQPATFQRFSAPSLPAFPFQALIPSDLDGVRPPPAGSPNYFMRHRDGEANGDPPDPVHDILEIWEFRVDWNTPANSTFTGPTNILVSEFDSELCGFSSFFCFPQPGTSVTLDPLREVIMWRLQYRNFGAHETLTGNFVTDVDGTDHGGIRWFELRRTGGSWGLFQEGTYAPDAHHRWMGSIAMDGNGNMALGYSVSSSSVYPAIRYVGRLAGDPLGTMPQGEFTLINGIGSQTATTRWGDYSSMNVDPVDDCTFWYTNEYVGANGLWRTRIGSFKFPSCSVTHPVADIKANGSDSPIDITSGDTLSVTVELASGDFTGDSADWWAVADTPCGWYYYDLSSDSWMPGFVVTYQGPLFALSPFEVVNMSGLCPGTFTFYFGIDMKTSGLIDFGVLFFDSVVVNVTS